MSSPNAAHKALAHLEQKYDGEVTIVTQNIDPLHEMAGSKNVLHMHGRDGEIRCMNCRHVFASDIDLTPQSVCPNCRTVGELRPNIVWFGEMPQHMDEIHAALERCGLFVAIGTSGEVYPAAGFVLQVRRRSPRPYRRAQSRADRQPALVPGTHLWSRHAHRAALCRARAEERLAAMRRKRCPT